MALFNLKLPENNLENNLEGKSSAKLAAYENLQASARERATVSFGFNHSKILLAKTNKDHLCITGSGNFSENAYNEQYTICNDERIYTFYYDCIRDDSPESRGQRLSPSTGKIEVV